MRNGGTLQRDRAQVLLRILQTLADRFGNFGSLAETVSDAALAVANDDQSGELHNAAALNGLGNAVQGNDFFGEFLGFLVAVAAIPSVIVICHFVSSSR